MKKHGLKWQWLLLVPLCFAYGCQDKGKDDGTPSSPAYNPDETVVVTGFTPEEGSAHQQLLITGSNFGNDPEIVSVTIGGQKAVIVSVSNNYIYCFVPAGAHAGKIVVKVGKNPDIHEQSAEAATTFNYKSEMIVSTICGYRTENDDQGWREGSFMPDANGNRYSGFRSDSFLARDPQNPNHIYISYDGGHTHVQLIDLEKQTVTNAFSVNRFSGANTERVRSIDFSLELPQYGKAAGQYLIISFDANHTGNETPNVFMIERNAKGGFDDTCPTTLLASFKQCNGATVHPNGEIYFNSYDRGQLFRFDLNDYFANPSGWDPVFRENHPHIKQLFTIADPSWEYKIFIHPTGMYAYIVVINQHYILRTDYNTELKRFVTPYVVAGGYKMAGYQEGVGTSARINRPYQGVFVKNPEYVGGNDEYDFYFTEFSNHCVSKLTPDGVISTFAGRGSLSRGGDGNDWGADDGALRTVARFRDPSGLHYDEATETFYVISTVGRTLRTISLDKGTSTPATPETPAEGE